MTSGGCSRRCEYCGQVDDWRCRCAGAEAAQRVSELEAARRAYASEFPPNEEGEPDVGSIHENIRRLKGSLQALALCADRISAGDASAIPALRHQVLELRKMGLIP